jgi:hypothetical protein
MSKTLLCATIGVPERYSCPSLLGAHERYAFDPIFTIRCSLSVVCADTIAMMVRHHKTNDVYRTHGGFSDDEKLCDQRKKWTVCPEYKKKLKRVSKRFRTNYQEVLLCDQSFRVKRYQNITTYFSLSNKIHVHLYVYVYSSSLTNRGKGNISVTDAMGISRHVVWFETTLQELNEYVGSWFDISISTNLPNQGLWECPSEIANRSRDMRTFNEEMSSGTPRVPRRCHSCSNMDTRNRPHKACRCKAVHYCNRACQKAAWMAHKKAHETLSA